MKNWKEYAWYDLELPADAQYLAMLPPVSDAYLWHLTLMDENSVVCIHPESVPYVLTRHADGTHLCAPLSMKEDDHAD